MDPGQPLRHLTPARPRSKPGRGSTGSSGQPRGLSLPLLEEDLFLHLSPVCLSVHSSVTILPIFYPSTHSSSICIVFHPSNCPLTHLPTHPSIIHPLSILPLFLSSIHPPQLHPFVHPSIHSTQSYTGHKEDTRPMPSGSSSLESREMQPGLMVPSLDQTLPVGAEQGGSLHAPEGL